MNILIRVILILFLLMSLLLTTTVWGISFAQENNNNQTLLNFHDATSNYNLTTETLINEPMVTQPLILNTSAVNNRIYGFNADILNEIDAHTSLISQSRPHHTKHDRNIIMNLNDFFSKFKENRIHPKLNKNMLNSIKDNFINEKLNFGANYVLNLLITETQKATYSKDKLSEKNKSLIITCSRKNEFIKENVPFFTFNNNKNEIGLIMPKIVSYGNLCNIFEEFIKLTESDGKEFFKEAELNLPELIYIPIVQDSKSRMTYEKYINLNHYFGGRNLTASNLPGVLPFSVLVGLVSIFIG